MPPRTGTCNQRSITGPHQLRRRDGISLQYCKLTNLAEGDKSRMFKRINK